MNVTLYDTEIRDILVTHMWNRYGITVKRDDILFADNRPFNSNINASIDVRESKE
jgi:hypothetical protein